MGYPTAANVERLVHVPLSKSEVTFHPVSRSNKSPLTQNRDTFNEDAAAQSEYKENTSSAVLVGDTWVKNCSSPFDNIDFEDPRIVGSLVPLGIVCLIGPGFVFGLTLLLTVITSYNWWLQL